MNNSLQHSADWISYGWRGLVVTGIASILLGILAVTTSALATLVTVFILGGIVLAGGLVHAMQAFGTRSRGGFLGHVLAAILYSIAGGFMVLRPGDGAMSFTLLIGMLLAVSGLYQAIVSALFRYRGWGWECANGVVGILLGVAIFAAWPFYSMWLIGTFVGVDLIMRGWSALMLALSLRDVAKLFTHPLPEGRMERRGGPRDRRQEVLATM